MNQLHTVKNGGPADAKTDADVTLRQQLGVTETSFKRYYDDCERERARLRELRPGVAERRMEIALSRLDHTLEGILRNLHQDPDDIRVEIALPSLIRRLVDSVEEYLRLASTPRCPPATALRLHEILDLAEDGANWLERLHERMKANDSSGVLARVQVLSALFRNDEQRTQPDPSANKKSF